jgi:hypothetical protein
MECFPARFEGRELGWLFYLAFDDLSGCVAGFLDGFIASQLGF